MRKDIVMDLDSGDINSRRIPPAYSCPISWASEDDFFIYGECVLGDNLDFDNLSVGIGLYMDRVDSTKKIKITFTKTDGRGVDTVVGPIQVVDINNNELKSSQLFLVSDDFFFRGYLSEDRESLTLASGYEFDLNVQKSLEQNEFYILAAKPSSLYPNPLSGVDIRKYLNGNITSSDLPQKIQSEYLLDGMRVINIQYNDLTGEIITQTEEI